MPETVIRKLQFNTEDWGKEKLSVCWEVKSKEWTSKNYVQIPERGKSPARGKNVFSL